MTAEEFSRLCDESGLKKAKIAEILGVSPATVSNYVGGKSKIPLLVAEKMREVRDRSATLFAVRPR